MQILRVQTCLLRRVINCKFREKYGGKHEEKVRLKQQQCDHKVKGGSSLPSEARYDNMDEESRTE